MPKDKRVYNSDANQVFEERFAPKGFLRVPNMWFYLLIPEEKKYPHVPASFWKFMLILWHELFFVRANKPDWTATLGMRDFGINKGDASKWANALAGAPNLFTLSPGSFPDLDKTTFTYNSKANWIDWLGFYRGFLLANDWRSGQKVLVEDWQRKVKELVEEQTDAIKRAVEDGTFRG